jgi:signal transduction histidine kinase
MFLNGSLGEMTPVQRQKLQIMFTDAERLAALIQDILDIQKLELGQLRLDIRQASAKDIIEQSISSLLPRAELKNVKLSNALDQDLVLECDSGRIIQVLSNLITNGIKFSPNNSTIVIGAKLEDHSVVFDVTDSGIGIPKEEQNKLFTKFYQVDTSLTRMAGGTGLGLVICKGIVEAHKGKIWFTSEAGKGSRFSFSIRVGDGVGK